MPDQFDPTDLKTPQEWQKLTGVVIMDADGWGGRNARPFTDKINYSEWCDRMSRSTFRVKTVEHAKALLVTPQTDKDADRSGIINRIITDFETTYVYFLLEKNFHDSPVVQAAYYSACEKMVNKNPAPDAMVQSAVLDHLAALRRDAMQEYIESIELIFEEVSSAHKVR